MKLPKTLTKTRIIGLILLAIAILTYFTGRQGSTVLGVAGIILLITPTKYGQHIFDLFINTFSRWKTIIIIALYDAVYWMLVFGAVFLFQWQLNIRATTAQAATVLTKGALASPDLVSQNLDAIKGLMTFIIVGVILLVAFCYILYTLSRGLIWTTITNQKPTKKFYKGFFKLNAIWWAIWLPLFLLVSLALKSSPTLKDAFVVLFVGAVYFSPIVHSLYMLKHNIGYSLSNGFGWGVGRVHRFIIPYTFAIVLYIIIYQIFRIAPANFAQPASMLFVVVFLAWLRVYLYSIIKEFK